jgi:superkiller protein 3
LSPYVVRIPLDFIEQDTTTALQSSIFARRVIADVYLQDQDYQVTITVSEAGLELVNKHQEDSGSDLMLYVNLRLGYSQLTNLFSVRKAFNIALATSLVHLYPPKHHTRALRVLEEVLSEDPRNVECLMGRGYVLQRSGKWLQAASCFSRVIDIHPDEARDSIRAQEEHAWCQVQLYHLDEATTELKIVIGLLESEEDSEEDQSRSWWRLGRAYWEMGREWDVPN